MKYLIEVQYQILDRGILHPIQIKEIGVTKGKTAMSILRKEYNMYRLASDLSTKYQIIIIKETHKGFTN